jgi:CDP-glucose 4,6-dehydratase
MFNDNYRNKNVLITGHTGFKGSWLAYWLAFLGAKVTGYALAPQTVPNHFEWRDWTSIPSRATSAMHRD